LISLNEKFHKARHDYDVLMESSMSRYARPAPNPSTNPFGQAPPYQSGLPPFQPNRPLSGFGATANANASPPPSAHGYPTASTPSTSYPPAPPNWEGYQQPKPWEPPIQPPPPQQNPWETQHPQQAGLPSHWEGQSQPHDNLPGQWDNQYQQWDQDRPGAPSTNYSAPTQPPPSHRYGGGLDELASPVTVGADKLQQPWYDGPPGPPPGASGPNTSFPTTNTGPGGFVTQTSSQPHSYFSPPQQTKPDTRQDPAQQLPYPEQPVSYPPPPPTQAPPAIPFDQKPQTPYPVGKGQKFYPPPKPPATYNPQGSGDRYSSLRSLSAASDHEGSGEWYGSSSAGKATKDEGKTGNEGNGGYYGVST
jgi:hypothetical protein